MAFEVRLARARRASRPQYLRIQGVTLDQSAHAGDREVARDLYRRVLDDYPEDQECKYTAECLGTSLLRDGRPLDALRWLLDAMRRIELSPIGDSGTSGTVPMLVAEAMLAARDDATVDADVAEWLTRAEPVTDSPFPSTRYEFLLLSARVAHRRGDEGAADLARQALAVVEEPDPFRRHPGVGQPRATNQDVAWLRNVASDRTEAVIDESGQRPGI